MLLAVDIGNTQTVLGLYGDAPGDSSLVTMWRIATDKSAAADDISAKLYALFCAKGIRREDVTEVCLASVVPSLTNEWKRAAKGCFGVTPQLCTAKTAIEAGLFKCDYPHPYEIGADRVADAIAALDAYGAPVIVVDFGTATNIEIIDERGCFIGGIIAPGVLTSADALFKNATRLAAVDLSAPASAIGTCTDDAIKSGIVYGEAGRVDALLNRIFDETSFGGKASGGTCTVVATGGLASVVADHSGTITDVNSELTLEGLRLLSSRRR